MLVDCSWKEKYNEWAFKTYNEAIKTKTISREKYERIVRTLKGLIRNSAENSKFRFWMRSKGFKLNETNDQLIVSSLSGTVQQVAVVEDFFDIIYGVHIEGGAKIGTHAGQKRTYRAVTEKYAFIPREAVTHFILGCSECHHRGDSENLKTLLDLSPQSESNNVMDLSPQSVEINNGNITDISPISAKYSNRNIKDISPQSETNTHKALDLSSPSDSEVVNSSQIERNIALDLSPENDNNIAIDLSFQGRNKNDNRENKENSYTSVNLAGSQGRMIRLQVPKSLCNSQPQDGSDAAASSVLPKVTVMPELIGAERTHNTNKLLNIWVRLELQGIEQTSTPCRHKRKRPNYLVHRNLGLTPNKWGDDISSSSCGEGDEIVMKSDQLSTISESWTYDDVSGENKRVSSSSEDSGPPSRHKRKRPNHLVHRNLAFTPVRWRDEVSSSSSGEESSIKSKRISKLTGKWTLEDINRENIRVSSSSEDSVVTPKTVNVDEILSVNIA